VVATQATRSTSSRLTVVAGRSSGLDSFHPSHPRKTSEVNQDVPVDSLLSAWTNFLFRCAGRPCRKKRATAKAHRCTIRLFWAAKSEYR
jgi:hypothetical protein